MTSLSFSSSFSPSSSRSDILRKKRERKKRKSCLMRIHPIICSRKLSLLSCFLITRRFQKEIRKIYSKIFFLSFFFQEKERKMKKKQEEERREKREWKLIQLHCTSFNCLVSESFIQNDEQSNDARMQASHHSPLFFFSPLFTHADFLVFLRSSFL